MQRLIPVVCLLLAAARASAAGPSGDNGFDRRVAPLLAQRCLSCHNATEKKGGLDLSRKAGALAGGESGAVLVPGKPAESYLWQRIAGDEMPPKDPLTKSEKQVLRKWIEAGAGWGTDPIDPFRFTTDSRAGYDWWSLQPLGRPELPPQQSEWGRNAIDRFIAARLREKGLSPSPEADRRTLIRRLSFDLTGLPPAPEEVRRFLDDESPDAYRTLVDRLLDSPRYGERWARHWLDVVRFGESQGFERDKLRPNAWRYRDWVIDALNGDMPYDEFARLQIAGDVLRPDAAPAIVATGFLVAGPYDEVGQNQQSAAMRAVVRQDELEDIVGTVGQTFLGLTVHCARCHDHKFDPIRQKDYYQLTAALAGVRHGERSLVTSKTKAEIAELQNRRSDITKAIEAIEQPVRDALLRERTKPAAAEHLPKPLARWDFVSDFKDSIGKLHGTAHGSAKIENGLLVLDGKNAYVSTAPLARPLKAKTLEAWVQLEGLDQRGGGVVSLQTTDGNVFDAIVYGEREPRRWLAGSDHFRRTQDMGGPDEERAAKAFVHVALVYAEDGTITAYRNGAVYGKPYKSKGPIEFPAGQSQVLFGLRHGTSPAARRLLAGLIDRAQLYDRPLTAKEVAASFRASGLVTPQDVTNRLTPKQRSQRKRLRQRLADVTEEIDSLRNAKAYAVAPRPPEPAHLLRRGNPADKGPVVRPAGIASLGLDADFGLKPDAPDATRRERLAQWITSENNPLFARVIANRLWHYHFGTGIVATPSDFGFNGGRPSHPELLDFLAGYLIEHDDRLKELHRLIVTSAAYRQRSTFRPDCAEVDAGNRLLWRKQPRRLEAEVLRDTVLAVAGQLNPQIGGPPYRDFITHTRNSQFYEMIDPVGPQFNRRTIYRTWLRSGRSPFLDAFDCPDPSTTTPKRAVTTTPTQSLALLNNSFVLRMSDRAAERLEREAGPSHKAQIARLLELAYARPPGDQELQRLARFADEHGMPALCRVVFNSNEFLYVD